MSGRLEDLKCLYENYGNWASEHLSLVSFLETFGHWSSFLISGKKGEMNSVSELLYSLSRLYSLFNDHAIAYARNISTHSPSQPGHSLKVALTAVEYLDITFEVIANHKLGKDKKWRVISALQMFKTFVRLKLLYEKRSGLFPFPPVSSLSRNSLEQELGQPIPLQCDYFTLKSGRTIKKVTEGPFILENIINNGPKPNHNLPRDIKLNDTQRLAELIFILKPIIHLFALRKWGYKSYKPWLISLFFDLISLSIYRYHPSGKVKHSSQEEEVKMRYFRLILYIFRSPFYDKLSRNIIDEFLVSLKTTLPFLRWLIDPLHLYLSKWQKMYFYMWSH